MGRKSKFSFEVKLDIVKRCLDGKTSVNHEAKLLRTNNKSVNEWISLYQSLGEDGLITTSKNTSYSVELKNNAVKEYIIGMICFGNFQIRHLERKKFNFPAINFLLLSCV